MPDDWYSLVDAHTTLTQGDLISNCPLVGWKDVFGELTGADETEQITQARDIFFADTVIMTQACDLENDKVTDVVLCAHSPISLYREQWEAEFLRRGQTATTRAWEKHVAEIRSGFIWNLSLLNAEDGGAQALEHRVVDFHSVYTLPKTFLEGLLQQRGGSRFRLLPPYREHLSQAFARFFMRVGLPVPVGPVPNPRV
jgi:hypothetical protein